MSGRESLHIPMPTWGKGQPEPTTNLTNTRIHEKYYPGASKQFRPWFFVSLPQRAQWVLQIYVWSLNTLKGTTANLAMQFMAMAHAHVSTIHLVLCVP